jgi:hypothetical protein
MRQERTTQASLFDGFAGHETGRELKAMSEWLDGHRELLDLVTKDLCRRRQTPDGTACPRNRRCVAGSSSSIVS